MSSPTPDQPQDRPSRGAGNPGGPADGVPPGIEEAAPQELTILISRAAEEQDADAQAELMSQLYARLRAMAARQTGLRPATLQATALVHEAYLRMFSRGPQRFDGRGHFFAAVATVMRQIAIDQARARRAHKRGGDWKRTTLAGLPATPDQDPDVLVQLEPALEKLAELAPRQAQVVEMRFFANLTVEQTASALGVSPRTVELDWRTARAFLQTAFDGDNAP